jgi:predicted  nucleic acid-binding Zn-ribbon protein
MRGKLRAGGGTVGFFAFQDIITAVIGIVIFIALLLSLFIGTESDAIRKKRIAAQATPDQIHELSALLVKIQQMQSALAATLSLPVGAPEAELIQLQDWLQTLSAQIENIRKNTPVSTDLTKKFELDLKALEMNLAVQQARLEKLNNEVNTISNINENIQNKILELQKAILEEEKKINDIWLIPDESITTKRPLLVTVSSEAMELRSLDGILKQTKGNLKELLQDFNSLEFYVVFYLKPSAFPRGEEILDETKKLGFEVGYEPIREDQNINFGKSIL